MTRKPYRKTVLYFTWVGQSFFATIEFFRIEFNKISKEFVEYYFQLLRSTREGNNGVYPTRLADWCPHSAGWEVPPFCCQGVPLFGRCWVWYGVAPPPHQHWIGVPPGRTGWGYPPPHHSGDRTAQHRAYLLRSRRRIFLFSFIKLLILVFYGIYRICRVLFLVIFISKILKNSILQML